ncbi:bestrophin-like domain [Legionella sp. WA2022007384]
MLYSLINNCFPTFIFLFYLLVFAFFSRIVSHYRYKQKSVEFVTTEAIQLYIIGESSRAFSPEAHQGIVHNLTQYISSILNDELVAMSRGHECQKTQEASDKLYDELLKFKPAGPVSTYYNNAVSSLNQAIEYRNFRLNMLHSPIPTAWYLIIFMGAFFIIGIYSLETNLKGHLFLIILCIFLAIYMTTITVLSFPFSGFLKFQMYRLKKFLRN